MEDAKTELNKPVVRLKSPERTPEAKEPWEVTQEDFGKQFYVHGRRESRIQQIRETGIIPDGSFIRILTPKDAEIAYNFATNTGNEPGVIFVARVESFKNTRFIQTYYPEGGYPHIFEMSNHVGTPIPYIAEIPATRGINPHKYLVEKALHENKAVPTVVLAEYPDLAAQSKPQKPKVKKGFFSKFFR